MTNDSIATLKMKTIMERSEGKNGSASAMTISNNGTLSEVTIEDKGLTQKQIYSSGIENLEPLMKFLLNEYDFY